MNEDIEIGHNHYNVCEKKLVIDKHYSAFCSQMAEGMNELE